MSDTTAPEISHSPTPVRDSLRDNWPTRAQRIRIHALEQAVRKHAQDRLPVSAILETARDFEKFILGDGQ